MLGWKRHDGWRCLRVRRSRLCEPDGAKLSPDSQAVLRFTPEDRCMNKTRILLFGSVVAGAMVVGGVIGATGLVKSPVAAFAAAASPTSTPKSNEATTHESGE